MNTFKRDLSKERKRKKEWHEKVIEVKNSLLRVKNEDSFIALFYKNLFYLNPELEKYFLNTKWDKQEIALSKGIDHLIGLLEDKNSKLHRQNIVRLAQTHSFKNMNIHPHSYYYWIDAMIMTMKEKDPNWYDDLQFYTRECLFFPISFIISFYHKD